MINRALKQWSVSYFNAVRALWALACASTLLAVEAEFAQAREDEWTAPEALNVEAAPEIDGLPELMRFADGRPVVTQEDWEARRHELKSMLSFYVYGSMPPAPKRVALIERERSWNDELRAIEERGTLSIGANHELRLRIAVYTPRGGSKFPVLIREEHALGHLEEAPRILERGYMFVEFAREDLAPDRADAKGSAQRAYPDHDWGVLAVWAWGAMWVMDYLETRSDVDLEKVGVVGHSRGGKMALLAGALDERFALVAPNGSGAGGAGSFRIGNGREETLELITRPDRFGYWFTPRLRQFGDRETKLPVDQHFLKALVAPRALICTDALDDHWANPPGNRATSRAAQDVFEFLNVPNNNALHFRDGGHDLKEEDWQAILDFADWRFFQKQPEDIRVFQQFK